MNISFAMQANVRDNAGRLAQVWLPYGGHAYYHAHYSDGTRSNLPQSVAVTYRLTPSAQSGSAPWVVQLHCKFLSIFRADNGELLARVRSVWQQWQQAHPIETSTDNADDEYDDKNGWENEEYAGDYIITLAAPPHGTPPDNRELSERNTPYLHSAVARWEQRLGTSFEWAVTL